MANTSRINGFKPVKHLNGAPYNGQANLYEVPAGEAVPVFIGDLVKLSDSAATSLYPAVEAVVGASAQIAAGPILGAVVGIVLRNLRLDGHALAGDAGALGLIYEHDERAATHAAACSSVVFIRQARSV